MEAVAYLRGDELSLGAGMAGPSLLAAAGRCAGPGLACPVLARQGWLAGGPAGVALGADPDRFEQVVGGGPQVQFQVSFGVPVVQVAAEAAEQLGEYRFDYAGSLFIQGFALG